MMITADQIAAGCLSGCLPQNPWLACRLLMTGSLCDACASTSCTVWRGSDCWQRSYKHSLYASQYCYCLSQKQLVAGLFMRKMLLRYSLLAVHESHTHVQAWWSCVVPNASVSLIFHTHASPWRDFSALCCPLPITHWRC